MEGPFDVTLVSQVCRRLQQPTCWECWTFSSVACRVEFSCRAGPAGFDHRGKCRTSCRLPPLGCITLAAWKEFAKGTVWLGYENLRGRLRHLSRLLTSICPAVPAALVLRSLYDKACYSFGLGKRKRVFVFCSIVQEHWRSSRRPGWHQTGSNIGDKNSCLSSNPLRSHPLHHQCWPRV